MDAPRYVTWAILSSPGRGEASLVQRCRRAHCVARGPLGKRRSARGTQSTVPQDQDGRRRLLPLRPLLRASRWSLPLRPSPRPLRPRDLPRAPAGRDCRGRCRRGRRVRRSLARRSFLLAAWTEGGHDVGRLPPTALGRHLPRRALRVGGSEHHLSSQRD